MSARRCPSCGEPVESTSLTCPRCFGEVPREAPVGEPGPGRAREGRPSPGIALVLALVPPLFGLLGLGQLYGFRRVERGLFFLAVGLAIYVPMIGIFMLMLKSGILSAILLFVLDGVLLLAYLAVALAAFMDAAFGASLRFGIRR